MTEDANNNCRLAVTWLDEVDGMCSWNHISAQNSKLNTFTSGIAHCLRSLAMLYQPFVMQIAFACASDWETVFANSEAVNSVFEHCPCGSVMQIAFASASDWEAVFANSEAVNSVFEHCPCG